MPRAMKKQDRVKEQNRQALKEIIDAMEKYEIMCTLCSEPFDDLEVTSRNRPYKVNNHSELVV